MYKRIYIKFKFLSLGEESVVLLGCNINLDATYLVFKQKGHNSLS